MNDRDEQIARRLRAAPAAAPAPDGELETRFVTRLCEVVAQPDRMPLEIDGERFEARRGGTLLGAAMKNGVRLMHVCGARALCTTCRVRIDDGAENLSAITAKERIALRSRLILSPRTRLACQARVHGRVEARSILPLCGNLPGE